MYKKVLFFIITLLSSYNSVAQVVLYIGSVPNDTPESDTLYLASSLNNWDPKDKEFAFTEDVIGIYNLELTDIDFPFEFKVTRGSWKNVETDEIGDRISNRLITSQSDLDTIEVKGWYDHLFNEANTASKNVRILNDKFEIPQLNRTRRIWIYLPESYSSSSERFPVIYMHDGQNLFNNATSFSGEWNVDETLDSIISAGGKKAIIVGIDNGGEHRIGELTPFKNKEYGGGEGHQYMEFICNTLKPYVDSNYRTLSDRDNTSIIGSSLGGLISFFGVIKYNTIFSKAGVLSPSFWFSDRIYYIPRYLNRYPIKIYFAAGDSESDSMIPNINKMIEKMKKMEYPNDSYKLRVMKGAKHNEMQWSEEFGEMYNWLMN